MNAVQQSAGLFGGPKKDQAGGLGGIFASVAHLVGGKAPPAEEVLDASDVLPPESLLKTVAAKEKAPNMPRYAYHLTQLILDAQHAGLQLHSTGEQWDRLVEAAFKRGEPSDLKALASAILRFSPGNASIAYLCYRMVGEKTGDHTAWCNCGVLLYQGPKGMSRDIARAQQILEKQADQGYPVAQLNLGTILIREGIDAERAIALWEKAGAAGHPAAYLEIGKAYLTPRGVERDLAKAYQYTLKAANAKDTEAQYIIGVMLMNGQGPSGQPDKRQAFLWMEKAAAKGHPNSLYNVGQCYFIGDGVAKDARRAVDYWIMAADRDMPMAQINLGRLYWEGRAGVHKDAARARELWSKAATRKDMFGEQARALLDHTKEQ